MSAEMQIPEDLKDRHNELRVWLSSPQQYREERPAMRTFEDEMQDIERIARLEAENAKLRAEVERLRGNLYDVRDVVTVENFAEMQQRAEKLEAENARLSEASDQFNAGWKSCIKDLRKSAEICRTVEAENRQLREALKSCIEDLRKSAEICRRAQDCLSRKIDAALAEHEKGKIRQP